MNQKALPNIKQTNSIRASFQKSQGEGCPRQMECRAKIRARSAFVIISVNAWKKADTTLTPEEEEVQQFIGRIRNGVETVPSVLRNKYNVDKIPVRRKLKTKLFFGFKVVALNCTKLFRFIEKRTTAEPSCQHKGKR